MALFSPSKKDIYDVRAILAFRKLPNELILAILDRARYWVEFERNCTQDIVLMAERLSFDYSAAFPYCALPLPHLRNVDDEVSKIREVEFLLVGHDQGWTTEDTEGTYQTSSWFEVSILRPKQPNGVMGVEDDAPSSPFYPDACSYGSVHQNVQEAVQAIYPSDEMQLVPRTSLATEPQRLHCDEMINATASDHDAKKPRSQNKKEGEHAWFLQGNEVARGLSVFDGEMVRRYNVVWSSASTPRWVGNGGSGKGEGFVDALQEGDCILVWARAKASYP